MMLRAVVIGKTFAWGHLPKTGGDATAEMFRVFGDLVEFEDPPDSDDKHTLFRDRAKQVAGKRLLLNFRRLPEWVLSRAHHVNRYGLAPEYKPLPMDSPQQLAESSFPDYRLATFTDSGSLEIDTWLRIDTLPEDFLAFVSELRDVTDEERTRVIELGRVNEGNYDRELSHWFTAEQMRTLYGSNPTWAAIEERLYGNLVAI
jgi:hypothetical protein